MIHHIFSRAIFAAFLILSALVQGDDPPAVPDAIKAAVDSAERPAEERARDPHRKPDQVLAFAGIEAGDRVADLSAGTGYYTDILSRLVGSQGAVIAQNTPAIIQRFPQAFGEDGPFVKRLASPQWTNVKRLDSNLDDPGLPKDLDAAIMILFYHDTYWLGVDRAKMNRAIFDALKPGGVFLIVDHHAQADSGDRDVQTFHRVDAELVKKEIMAAGFVLEGTSDLLRHEEDTRDFSIFRDFQTNRDHTDRFIYKFVKPAM